MRKFVALQLVVVSLLFIALVGCGSDASQPNTGTNAPSENSTSETSANKPKVTVILQSLTSEYWKFVQAGAKQAFEDFNVEGTILGPSAESEIMVQVNMLEDTLTQGTDALVVSATQPDTVVSTFEKYKENGIPVILINQDVDWADKETFIGTDNFTAGKKAGELLASQLQEGDKVALIRGQLGSKAHDDRINGAKEALEAVGIEVAAEQPADSDRMKAMSVMENILESDPDIKGVFASSDDMALGALKGVQNRGVDIPVVGLDGTIESIQAVIDGDLAGTVAQNPYDMGYKGVESATKVINGESIEKRIDTGADVITKDNAQEKMDFLNSLSN